MCFKLSVYKFLYLTILSQIKAVTRNLTIRKDYFSFIALDRVVICTDGNTHTIYKQYEN